MPRNALLSRNSQPGPGTLPSTATPPQPVPTIRFVSATPSTLEPSEPQIENMDAYPLPTNRTAPFTAFPLAPRLDTDAEPRKKLVPKKSKLALLAAGTKNLGKDKFRSKSRADDLSDVVRRVGAGSSSTGGFEIYVDHCEDADDASILMVKKKKSRAALDDVQWGPSALGEVTNVASNPGASSALPKEPKPIVNTLKIPTKADENQNSKWWNVSIGRGRKDAKEKIPVRSKTPEPFSKPTADTGSRDRFNSLDSRRLLSFAQALNTEQPPPVPPKDVPVQPQPAPHQRSGTFSSLSTLLNVPGYESGSDGLLAPPTPVEDSAQGQGSIALRAMKSMARMKSWANLGNDKSEKEGNTNNNDMTTTIATKATTATMKTKVRKTKEKKKKEDMNPRISTSSFEVGAPSVHDSLMLPPPLPEINRKPSKLALGGLIPGSLRLSTVRSTGSRVSSTSSRADTPVMLHPPPANGLYALSNARLSALDSSAHLVLDPDGRPTSAYSMSSSGSSSLRPPSSASAYSRSSGSRSASAFSARSSRSSSSSMVSVRWNEDCLQGTREIQRRERAERKGQHGAKESRRSAEGRRRTTVAEIFPEIRASAGTPRNSLESNVSGESKKQPLVVTLDEATTDGSSGDDTPVSGTPAKRARPRPMSEQLLGKARPKAMMDNTDGVLSILDAATNELASLINRLDLEATPASTAQGSPLRPLHGSPSIASLGKPGDDSPLKAKKHILEKTRDAPVLAKQSSFASVNSLRPYGQTIRVTSNPAAPPTRQQAAGVEARRMRIGQQIAPWRDLEWQVSPRKGPAAQGTVKPFRPTHRRNVTPGPEDLAFGSALQPLKPLAKQREASVESLPSADSTPVPAPQNPAVPSSQTFGSGAPVSKLGKSPSADLGYDDAAPPSPSPPTKRLSKQAKKLSVLSVICDTGATLSPESLKNLGLTGTLGGPEPDVDDDDPDSDIPDELQAIMSGQSDDETTQSFEHLLTYKPRSRAPSPGMPPMAALPSPQDETKSESEEQQPVFRASLFDEEANQTDIDEGDGSASEDDTKKSFDFTGELRLLSESGGSDRRSFVEQLENAFRTPSDVSLGLELGADLFLKDAPPVRALPLEHREPPDEDMVPQSVTDSNASIFHPESSVEQSFRNSATSDTLERLLAQCEEDICRPYVGLRRSQSTMRSKESDGKLNTSFRFGSRLSISSSLEESSELKPQTLSDIIPPISHSRSPSHSSLMEGDSSVLKSIPGKAYENDSSVVDSIVTRAQAAAPAIPRRRLNSGSSSGGQARDSFNLSHSRPTSELSFKGFEAFDEVRRGFEFHPNRPSFYPPPGAPQPWHNKHESFYSFASVSSYGAALNSGAADPFGYAFSRPASISDETSFAMSSTVDDTFSFVRKTSQRRRVDSDASSFDLHPGAARGHYPPISLYNRSLGPLRRNDSGASMSSPAQSSIHSAHGSHTAWARHRQEPSGDSSFSDFSMANVARPGLGDKMFERADYGMPLAAIAASPTNSFFSEQDDVSRRYSDISEQGMSYDSIFDAQQRASITDSILEKTGMPTSYEASEDIFEFDLSRPGQAASPHIKQFRPVSMMSVASTHSGHSARKDEDTMITMLGGGHVRRRSVHSLIDGSPCVDLERKERKKHTALQHLSRVLQFDQGADELPSNVVDQFSKFSPEKVVLPKPSIASTSSYQFGSEHMIKVGQGLLERQSLKDDALTSHEVVALLEPPPVFSHPGAVGRSRSSTVTSVGTETPPLSASDNSSVSSGSQSSIDLGQLNNLLVAATLPVSGIVRTRSARMRARGSGHRRPRSSVRVSRASVYETIQEETVVYASSPSPVKPSTNVPNDKDTTVLKDRSPRQTDSIYIVDPDTASDNDWTSGIVSLRKYYELREEAEGTVTESKRLWADTPFSTFAMQSFKPPSTRSDMQAMLEHSQQSYGPLPSELRPNRVRSRTSSRVSPYPVRSRRVSTTAEQQSYAPAQDKPFASPHQSMQAPVREISINPAITVFSLPPVVDAKLLPAFAAETEQSKPAAPKGSSGLPRPRVAPNTRRTALGWSKRNNGRTSPSSGKTSISTAKDNTGTVKTNTSSSRAKENAGTIFSHKESLRITRPRPLGRPNPARAVLTAAQPVV